MEVRNMNQMQKAYKPLNCSQIMAAGFQIILRCIETFSGKIKGCCNDYLHLLPIGR